MSMLFIDGFNHYDSIAMKWDSVSASNPEISTSAGRFSDGYINVNAGTFGSWVTKHIDTPDGTAVVIGFAYYFTANQDSSWTLLDNAGDEQCCINLIGASGEIEARRGAYNVGTVLGITSTSPLTESTYQYIEVKFLVDDTVGSVEVKVDGVQVLNLTGQDTQHRAGNDVASARLTNNNDNGTARVDDLYILDASGAAPYNDFLGDVRVSTLRPNAAGASADFTPVGDSANHLTTDEIIIDEDTTYNKSGILTARDSLAMQAMSDVTGTVGTIYGVQVTNGVEKTDAGSIRFKNAIRSGTTYYDGAEYEGTVTYKFRMEMHQVDPNTSAAWTETNVDAAQSGYVITYKET